MNKIKELSQEQLKYNDLGFRAYFTGLDIEGDVHPMAIARGTSNMIARMSSPKAIEIIKNGYFAGPIHFSEGVEGLEGGIFFDVDLTAAYASYLLKYADGDFNYKVGGVKKYHKGLSYLRRANTEGLKVFKIEFAFFADDVYKTRAYKYWLNKTVGRKVGKLLIDDKFCSGHILLPHVDDLVNRFLADIQLHERHTVAISDIIQNSGHSPVFINKERLRRHIEYRNRDHFSKKKEYKNMLNHSTGYIAHMEKTLYFTMINHIRLVLLYLMEALENHPVLKVVAANTDGLTIWGTDEVAVLDFLGDAIRVINKETGFRFRLKDTYTMDQAHVTPHDIRRKRNETT